LIVWFSFLSMHWGLFVCLFVCLVLFVIWVRYPSLFLDFFLNEYAFYKVRSCSFWNERNALFEVTHQRRWRFGFPSTCSSSHCYSPKNQSKHTKLH
jgi:hypothetical protein